MNLKFLSTYFKERLTLLFISDSGLIIFREVEKWLQEQAVKLNPESLAWLTVFVQVNLKSVITILKSYSSVLSKERTACFL